MDSTEAPINVENLLKTMLEVIISDSSGVDLPNNSSSDSSRVDLPNNSSSDQLVLTYTLLFRASKYINEI